MAKYKKFPSRDNDSGYVYIASNPSVIGLKIGLTSKSVEARMKELSKGTGVPAAYKAEYYVWCRRIGILERRMHEYFAEKRIKNSREFFDVPLSEAREALNKFLIETESEIENSPKLKKIFETISILEKDKSASAAKSNWDRFNEIKKDISYLTHTGYSEDRRYERAVELQNRRKFFNA